MYSEGGKEILRVGGEVPARVPWAGCLLPASSRAAHVCGGQRHEPGRCWADCKGVQEPTWGLLPLVDAPIDHEAVAPSPLHNGALPKWLLQSALAWAFLFLSRSAECFGSCFSPSAGREWRLQLAGPATCPHKPCRTPPRRRTVEVMNHNTH